MKFKFFLVMKLISRAKESWRYQHKCGESEKDYLVISPVEEITGVAPDGGAS